MPFSQIDSLEVVSRETRGLEVVLDKQQKQTIKPHAKPRWAAENSFYGGAGGEGCDAVENDTEFPGETCGRV